MRAVIRTTWDGVPAEAESVALSLTIDAFSLRVEVDAPYHGDPPPAGPPGPTWALWEHEVVELFVAGPGERYTEIELGPHGHHLVLRLVGRRNIVERCLPLAFDARILGTRWRGLATLPLTLLPPGPHTMNAYAIHGAGTRRRYLALHPVPGDAPDFHRLECFRELALTSCTAPTSA